MADSFIGRVGGASLFESFGSSILDLEVDDDVIKRGIYGFAQTHSARNWANPNNFELSPSELDVLRTWLAKYMYTQLDQTEFNRTFVSNLVAKPVNASQLWYMIANLGFLGWPIDPAATFDNVNRSLITSDNNIANRVSAAEFARHARAFMENTDDRERWLLCIQSPEFITTYTFLCQPNETQQMLCYAKCTRELLVNIMQTSHIINSYFFGMMLHCTQDHNHPHIVFSAELRSSGHGPELQITSAHIWDYESDASRADFMRESVQAVGLHNLDDDATSLLTWDSTSRNEFHAALDNNTDIYVLQSVYNRVTTPNCKIDRVFAHMTNLSGIPVVWTVFQLAILCGYAMRTDCAENKLTAISRINRPSTDILWQALAGVDNSVRDIATELNRAVMSINGVNPDDYAQVDLTMSGQQAICDSNWLKFVRIVPRACCDYSIQTQFAPHFDAEGMYMTLRL